MPLFIHQLLLFSFVVFTLITTMPKILEDNYSMFIVGFLMMFIYLSNFLLLLILSKFTFKGMYLTYTHFILFMSNLILYFYIDNIYIISISYLIFSIVYSLIMTYNDSIILEKYKDNYGKYRAIGSVFFVLMSFASYFLVKDYYILFDLMLISSTLLFINSFKLVGYTKNFHQEINIKKEYILNEKNFFIFSMLFNMSLGMYFSFYSIFLINLNYTMNDVFIIFGISVMAETIMLLYQNNIINRNHFLNVFNIMIFSIIMTVARFLLVQIFPNVFEIQLIANALHMFTFSLFFGAMLSFLKNKYPDKHFTYSKIYKGIGIGIGGGIGSIFGGLVYYYYPTIFFYIVALISFFSLYYLNLSRLQELNRKN